MSNVKLTTFANADEVAAAASAWLEEIEAANRAGKPHCVALEGGRIVRKFYAGGGAAGQGSLPFRWDASIFWGDERCVPPDDPESNYRIAQEMLFAPLKIAPGQIHRIRGEAPASAAAEATAEICRLVPLDASGQPLLDIIFLGTGEDGHVASLFPGESEAVRARPGGVSHGDREQTAAAKSHPGLCRHSRRPGGLAAGIGCGQGRSFARIP